MCSRQECKKPKGRGPSWYRACCPMWGLQILHHWRLSGVRGQGCGS
ncbi:MAG: hypothetical protein MK025_13370 [Acidobacteriia bacterium]|nr:hypothetical protein [Terriglobia bacterium]